jgi:hypothetical protein
MLPHKSDIEPITDPADRLAARLSFPRKRDPHSRAGGCEFPLGRNDGTTSRSTRLRITRAWGWLTED